MDNTSETSEKDKLIKNLKEANSELAQQLQHYKITASQKDNDNIELLREMSELRLQLCKIRCTGADNAQQLDAAIQSGFERTIQHLFQASNVLTTTVQLTKRYFQEQRKLEIDSPRWSNIGNTPSEKVHRVPPMMGGRSIQPVVALSRSDILNNISDDSAIPQRNLNQSHNTGNRAVPMHLLQNVYIPLTRIDMPNNSMENGVDTDDVADGNEDEDADAVDPQQDLYDEMLNLNASRILDAVAEDLEPSDAGSPTRMDDPMEGPSWMLGNPRVILNKCDTSPVRQVFTPTVRRRPRDRDRDSPPPCSPLSLHTPNDLTQGASQMSPHTPHSSHTPRVFQRVTSPRRKHGCKFRNKELKVMVPKMRLDLERNESGGGGDGDGDGDENGIADGDGDEGGASPPKRPAIDAPSPQGSTDAAVVVLSSPEVVVKTEAQTKKSSQKSRSRRQRSSSNDSRKTRGNDNRDSDSSDSRGDRDSRTRRTRKAVTYREVPLNRKMRR